MGCGIIEAMGIKARSCGLDQTWEKRQGHQAWGLALGYRTELRRGGRHAAPCLALEMDGSWMLVPVMLTVRAQGGTEPAGSPHELRLTLAAQDPEPALTELREMMATVRPDGMTALDELAQHIARMARTSSGPTVLQARPGWKLDRIYGPQRVDRAAGCILNAMPPLTGMIAVLRPDGNAASDPSPAPREEES